MIFFIYTKNLTGSVYGKRKETFPAFVKRIKKRSPQVIEKFCPPPRHCPGLPVLPVRYPQYPVI
jgi:hypothetical protein